MGKKSPAGFRNYKSGSPVAWPTLARLLDLFGRTQFRRLRTSLIIFPRGIYVNSKALIGIREKNEEDFS